MILTISLHLQNTTMSKIFKSMVGAILLGIFIMLGSTFQKANAQPGTSVSFQTFYNELSPHGQWIDDPEYGYVWAPNADRDFRPYYTNGRWVMTEYGNTWVSDYAWGWAPFHYGRWTHNNYYGWVWIPDNTWGPAWVNWRSGGDCYGWAPMAPRVSINVMFGPRYSCPNDWWVFIPQRHIYSNGWHRHYRGPRYNNTYINNTTIINNTYINNNNTYVIGPRRHELERATGRKIDVYNVRNENRPGRTMVRNKDVNIYRPEVSGPRNSVERPQQVVRNERGATGRSGRSERMNNEHGAVRAEQTAPDNNVVRDDSRRSRTERNNEATNSGSIERGERIAERPEQTDRPGRQRSETARNENNSWQNRNQSTTTEEPRNWRSRPQEQAQQQNRPMQRLERAEQQQRIENSRQQRWERQQQPERVDRQMQAERSRPQRSEQRVERTQPQVDRPAQVERSRPQRAERAETGAGSASPAQADRPMRSRR
jgi:hypothetical protein